MLSNIHSQPAHSEPVFPHLDPTMGDNMIAHSLQGRMLSKYRILEPLGRGGMARVYRAYHPQLDRYVAVKVMRTDLADDAEFQVRFQREARAVAALRHPNIVQVFDFDTEDDISYMVMELMAGDTLKTRLDDYRVRRERMPWGDMVRVLLDVLDGLAYAHSEGMIHRDIKPGNILLTQRGQAVLGDFGVAHIIGGTRYTAPNALMGTLQYMAPEQGLQGRSDARSDIYSLGIVLYEMLTHTRPFDADTPLAVLMKHVNDPLPLPRSINADIPESLERVVLKALAKKPEDRYPGAEAMAHALRAAAQQADIALPERISLPLSFTTEEAPSESVAVISGTTRKFMADHGFAEAETDATAGRTWASQPTMADAETPPPQQATSLATAGKELVSAMEAIAHVALTKTTTVLRKVSETASGQTQLAPDATPAAGESAAPARGRVGRAILMALALLGISNLGLLTFSALLGRWHVYERGWPIQIFLVSLGLCIIMYAAISIWILIPIGIIFGTGLLLTYCALTNQWEHWMFLWLLEVWIAGLSVIAPILLSKRPDGGRAWSQELAWLIGGASVLLIVAIAIIVILGPWFIPLVALAAGFWWWRRRKHEENSAAQ